MPDFDRLATHLRTDISHAGWPTAQDIRATGDHRRRTRLAATLAGVTAAVVAVVAAALLVPGATQHQAPPAASHSPTSTASSPASPSPSRSGSATPSTTPSAGTTIPTAALPTNADVVGGGFHTDGKHWSGIYAPTPFTGCGPGYGLPGGAKPAAAISLSFSNNNQNAPAQGGASVVRFRPGAAHQTLATIDQLMTGGCASHYQVASRNLGGDESLLISNTDPAAAGFLSPQARAVYFAIIRRGDYLVWVSVLDETHSSTQQSFAGHLAQLTSQRLCTLAHC